MSEYQKFDQSNTPDTKSREPEWNKGLTDQQIAATRFASRLGEVIQKEIPEIATDFINGLSLSKLVEKHNIKSRFGIRNNSTAQAAVSNALKGTEDKKKLQEFKIYPGLISAELWQKIQKEHRIQGSRTVGTRMRAEKRGLFAMTDEQRRQVALSSGANLYKNKMGIHAQTTEDRIKLGEKNRDAGLGAFSLSQEQLKSARTAGANSQIKNKIGIHSQTLEEKIELGNQAAIARGETPFSVEEIELVQKLASLPEYRRGKLTDMRKIAEAVNAQIHNGKPVRKSKTIISKLRNMKTKVKT